MTCANVAGKRVSIASSASFADAGGISSRSSAHAGET